MMQVPDTQVIGFQLAAAALVSASGHASSVPPLKKASAPEAARLVICADTSLAPVGYLSTATTSMSVPSIACWNVSS